MIKIKRIYQGFGRGSPGFNVKIIVVDEGREIAYHSWPNVNGPVSRGAFRNLRKEWYEDLEAKICREHNVDPDSSHYLTAEIQIPREEWEKFLEKYKKQ